MQVFKLYFKLFRKHIKSLFLYIFIFLSVFIAFSIMTKQNESVEEFNAVKVNIAVNDLDQSEMSYNFISYLEEKTNITLQSSDTNTLKDALFYNDVSYIIEIPKGFQEDFLQQKGIIHTQKRPDHVAAVLIDRYIDSYLDSVEKYRNVLPTSSLSDIHDHVMEDLTKQAFIDVQSKEAEPDESLQNIYFNYLSYVLWASIILAVGQVMLTINNTVIKKRNYISPIHNTSFNMQLFGANVVSVSIIWLFFIIALYVFAPEMFSLKGTLLTLNSYIFTMVILATTFLIVHLLGSIKKANDALQGISNLLSLGSSFLSGAFIPQMFLPETVLKIASFNPTYWYIRFNNEICALQSIAMDNITPLLTYMGIEILFGVTIIILALVISKSKRSSKEL